jgi:hypothetical protein
MKIIYAYLAFAIASSITAYTMEIITPGDFNDASKKYIEYAIQLWNESAQQGNIHTGLAVLFDQMGKKPIDDIINNKTALNYANKLYTKVISNPAIQALVPLKSIATLPNLKAAPQLQQQITTTVMQAIGFDALQGLYNQETGNNFNNPVGINLLLSLALTGPESIPYNIVILDDNKNLPANFLPYLEGSTLMWTYMKQHQKSEK